MDLAARVQRLEDDRAIRDLKARYLRACDLRQPDVVSDTLLPDGAIIAYEGFPVFDNRDVFVAVFQQFGCQPGVYDLHHATNGIISFDGNARATGLWSLHFKSIILATRTIMEMAVEYRDVYVKQDGRWWIAETRTTRHLFQSTTVDEQGVPTIAAMGDAPPVFGQ